MVENHSKNSHFLKIAVGETFVYYFSSQCWVIRIRIFQTDSRQFLISDLQGKRTLSSLTSYYDYCLNKLLLSISVPSKIRPKVVNAYINHESRAAAAAGSIWWTLLLSLFVFWPWTTKWRWYNTPYVIYVQIGWKNPVLYMQSVHNT